MTRRVHPVPRAALFLLCAVLTGRAATLTPGDYDHSMKLTFPGYTRSTPLTNFPAMVRFGSDMDVSYDGFASPNGADLRFTDSDGTTIINHEIEKWDTNGTSTVWVQVPELTGGGTDSIYAYWGNSGYETYDPDTFDPDAEIAGCVLWLKADTGVLTNLSGAVTNWLDQSGSGNHGSDVNGTPVFVASGIGGKPVVRFGGNGSGEYVQTVTSFTKPYTILTVSKLNGTDNNRLIASGTGNNWLMGYWSGRKDSMHAGNWVHLAAAGSADTSAYLYTASQETGESKFYRDGQILATSAYDLDISQLSLGAWNTGGEDSDGDVAEVLIFNRVLSNAERNKVGHYLAHKYGLTTSHVDPNVPDYALDGSTWSSDYVTVWHMSRSAGNPEDSTANANDGANNGLTTQVSGKIADAYEVNSDGDDLVIPPVANATFTADFWYYYSSTHNDSWNTVLCRDGGSYHHLLIRDSDRHIGFYHAGGGNFVDSGVALALGQWHHLAVVVDGTHFQSLPRRREDPGLQLLLQQRDLSPAIYQYSRRHFSGGHGAVRRVSRVVGHALRRLDLGGAPERGCVQLVPGLGAA